MESWRRRVVGHQRNISLFIKCLEGNFLAHSVQSILEANLFLVGVSLLSSSGPGPGSGPSSGQVKVRMVRVQGRL